MPLVQLPAIRQHLESNGLLSVNVAPRLTLGAWEIACQPWSWQAFNRREIRRGFGRRPGGVVVYSSLTFSRPDEAL